MKVSVIIPTFNVEKYIEQCVRSLTNQTVKDIEIILIDDVSSDSTVNLINTMAQKDARIKLIINERNSGPSYTRNQGIKRANGEYIAFLDSDDWWASNRLEKMLEIAENNDCDMVCDDQYLIDDRRTNPWGTVFTNGSFAVSSPTVFGPADFINKNMGLKPMIRREFLTKNQILFNENLRYGEDYLLFLDCLLHGAKAILLPTAYYYYRAREGSLVTNNMKLLEQTLKTTEELLVNPFYTKDPSVKGALNNRKAKIKEALSYYKFMQPIKDKKIVEGLTELVKNPIVLKIFVRRVPLILKNRVFKREKLQVKKHE